MCTHTHTHTHTHRMLLLLLNEWPQRPVGPGGQRGWGEARIPHDRVGCHGVQRCTSEAREGGTCVAAGAVLDLAPRPALVQELQRAAAVAAVLAVPDKGAGSPLRGPLAAGAGPGRLASCHQRQSRQRPPETARYHGAAPCCQLAQAAARAARGAARSSARSRAAHSSMARLRSRSRSRPATAPHFPPCVG